MARGDATNVLVANAASGTFTDRQPSAGVEELITSAHTPNEGSAPNSMSAIQIRRIDGTNDQSLLEDGDGGVGAKYYMRVPHVFDNTNYFSMAQLTGVNRDFVFSVVEAG